MLLVGLCFDAVQKIFFRFVLFTYSKGFLSSFSLTSKFSRVHLKSQICLRCSPTLSQAVVQYNTSTRKWWWILYTYSQKENLCELLPTTVGNVSHPLSDISLYKLSTQIRAGECEFLIGFKKGKKVAPTTLKATITNA